MGSPGVPLKPAAFDILLILMESPRHGYAVVRAMREREDAPRMDRGNVYRELRRMVADGLLETVPASAHNTPASARRPVFVVTAAGRQAARTEAHRLERLLRTARRHRLLIGE